MQVHVKCLMRPVAMALSKEMFELPIEHYKIDGMTFNGKRFTPESLETVKQFQPHSTDVLTTCYSKSGMFKEPIMK